jgi:hypothetical protein
MVRTLTELCEALKKVDEISLLEVLNITSEDIVEQFKDRIEEDYERLSSDFDTEDDEDPEV